MRNWLERFAGKHRSNCAMFFAAAQIPVLMERQRETNTHSATLAAGKTGLPRLRHK